MFRSDRRITPRRTNYGNRWRHSDLLSIGEGIGGEGINCLVYSFSASRHLFDEAIGNLRTKRHNSFLPVAVIILFSGLLLSTGAYLVDAFGESGGYAGLSAAPLHDSIFVFLSDTQSPLWPETFVLDENRNEDARTRLLEKIVSTNPGAVFHCGDLVALGFNRHHWDPVDRFVQELSERDIPFFPVPGNHEYIFFADRGIENFRGRYPYAEETGYRTRIGPVAVILLNSNFGEMTEGMVRTQDEWFRKTLESFEADTLIRTIIVACHHSPFTNSTIVDPSEEVQSRFVPLFLAAEKTSLFISGHCHAFEHFSVRNKQFLVTGGGGGLQQPLLLGDERRNEDLFEPASKVRMFHFLQGTIQPGNLTIQVRMLAADRSRFETTHRVRVSW